ncbi:PIG-L family deacetylase [Nocardiopsis akebiae]|uniref:PIG-L family deacetylase n=1 Tax=Nocardiopsis akebiae TaxID=2831968 RepID=A0ABX8BXX2_9ACTN|nr:PIG-L family deacetylase [Nocardiopsis akebiae]QUX26936.1 PIG-L family deacetylase [Nocardiopsis akebiae]
MTGLPSGGTVDHLVLSPHPDDAVWSLGARIARWRREGARVLVLTVFDGPDPDPVPGGASRALSAPPSARRAEDRAALSLLGLAPHSLGLADAAARRSDGVPRYPSVTRLFSTPHPDDAALVDRIAEAIARHRDGGTLVHAPLAAGDHVDHRLTRAAVERAGVGAPAWYEDFPYTVRARHRQGLARRASALTEADTEVWLEAARCYTSQARSLFGGTDALTAALRERARPREGDDPARPHAHHWVRA